MLYPQTSSKNSAVVSSEDKGGGVGRVSRSDWEAVREAEVGRLSLNTWLSIHRPLGMRSSWRALH